MLRNLPSLLKLAGLAASLVVALLFAVFVGDQGPWYFAWVIGTVMIVLVSASGAILFDAQQDRKHSQDEETHS